jgi:hypothetical protein
MFLTLMQGKRIIHISLSKFAENVGLDVFTETYFALSMTVWTGLVFLAGALSP